MRGGDVVNVIFGQKIPQTDKTRRALFLVEGCWIMKVGNEYRISDSFPGSEIRVPVFSRKTAVEHSSRVANHKCGNKSVCAVS